MHKKPLHLPFYIVIKDNPNIIAYSKVMVAYLVFGLCDEWYKRGMVESPEEILAVIKQQKSN